MFATTASNANEESNAAYRHKEFEHKDPYVEVYLSNVYSISVRLSEDLSNQVPRFDCSSPMLFRQRYRKM